MHSDGLHHHHIRKRIANKQPYPHPNKFKRYMDKVIYVIGVLGPLMTVPQIAKIFINKNAASVSLLSWTAYLTYAIFWLIYAIMHKEKPLIVTYVTWIVLEIILIIGIIVY